MDIQFVSTSPKSLGAYIIPVGELLKGRDDLPALPLPEVTQAQLASASRVSRFRGRAGDCVCLLAPAGLDADYLMLFGTGSAAKLTRDALVGLGGKLAAKLIDLKVQDAVLDIAGLQSPHLEPGEMAAHLAHGIDLRCYRFDRYKAVEAGPDEQSVWLENLTVVSSSPEQASAAHLGLSAVRDGVVLARDLANEPANHLYPETFAERLAGLDVEGLEVEILDETALHDLGMVALLAVGQGSERPSRVAVLRWLGGASPETAPVAFVGKGVTFDAGGISIKPATGMEDMKFDMAGAAAAAGVMLALARRKAGVNAVAVVGLVENMPSGKALRPGDVIASMAGKSIEVINTDAEGRLVLADILHYTHDRFKPQAMVNLATLTGAILTTLGNVHAGLFSNDDDLSAALLDAGVGSGEALWRLPMHDAYARQLKSDIADLRNLGTNQGQSITAAEFLKHFVGDTPWAHLDICGMAWAKEPTDLSPKGGTGFGVRLLDAWVRRVEAA